ncbi:Ig-like domain-containing protein [Clostridium felsineum]|uniref:Uncharacterized protein n=1 Tax=Clostridium felsineum TaxID=36839 RepID=A0A1S8LA51_9CLOT|nr:Ig domain-containing protein [Clostridium felsineum]URZ06121.1 hypothetical protein CLROS_014540 [Clostridium felsineum]URZ11158.1 hypothetical protein CROST_018750 [Clostridium felsineum]
MKSKFKVYLTAFLIVILGCFTSVYADTTNDGTEVGNVNLNNTTDNSAKVGNQLSHPEIGWKRYDDTNKNIDYKGDWLEQDHQYFLNNKYIYTNADNDTVSFNFVGTKLRIIGSIDVGRPNFIVKIDDKTYNATENGDLCYESIVFQELNLTNKEHKVTVTVPTITRGNVGYFILDAIDIDSTGYLVDPSATVATGITLDNTSLNMNVGDINTLTAAVTPDNATNKTLTWTSSDPSTAFVSNTGKIKALKPGKVTITAATIDGSNLKASCEVTINKMANSITLNKDVDDLLVGETDKLISLVSPDDATVKDVIWTSSDPAVISVDNNGNITALKSGNALIKATVQDGSGLHAQCRITVQ